MNRTHNNGTQSLQDKTEAPSAYFSAQNLIRDWGAVCVDVSFAAERGTMTAIVGPSGSGKSTVLRLIAGLEKRTPQHTKFHSSGSNSIIANSSQIIMLDGINITKRTPAKRGVGMVFQSHALFAHMKVDDNVAYGLRCSGMSKSESRNRADEYLQKFNLAGFGRRWPETLSGGEAQRVSLARTLIVEPKLVLFDEPLSALDAPLRKKLAADIRSLQKEIGFTGIWVTHDIAEAKSVADTIIMLKNGKIGWTGKPEDFTESMMETSFTE
jgi:ABC-type Fe3+/spermidine/putrescine transport system ATPase subunit